MADFEYHPDLCAKCFKPIAQDAPIIIVDRVNLPPDYYHFEHLSEEPDFLSNIYPSEK